MVSLCNKTSFDGFLRHSPDMLCAIDENGRIVKVSDSCEQILGYAAPELEESHYIDFVIPDDREPTLQTVRDVIQGNSVTDYVNKYRDKHGNVVYLSWSAAWCAENRLMYCIARAIQENQDNSLVEKSNELLDKQAKELSAILESISDAFFALDKDWRFSYVNSVFAEHEGYSRETLIGKSIWEVFPRLTSTEFYRKCMETIQSGEPSRFEESYAYSGVTYRFKLYPSAEGLSVFFTDITKEVKMQQELEKLALVARYTDNSVFITDAQRRTEWVNEAFTKTTGYTLAEMAGKDPKDVLGGPETDPNTAETILEDLKRGEPFSADIINYNKSGEKFWVTMDISPVYGSDGKLKRYIAIHRDITSQKEAEANLLRMTEDLYIQNSNLQQFTYIVSHNLRAPLANALGLANLLTKIDKSSQHFDMSLSHLRTTLVRMDTVLRDVNSILSARERQRELSIERVGLSDVIGQALSYLEEPLNKLGATVTIDVDKGAMVNANRAYLFSVFYNLLTNAITFRSPERPLHIAIRHQAGSNGGAVISFADNGTGFDAEKAGDNVFRFYKTFHRNIRGRGTGLFLVKTYLEAMGGRVEVKSREDAGTCFTICLP